MSQFSPYHDVDMIPQRRWTSGCNESSHFIIIIPRNHRFSSPYLLTLTSVVDEDVQPGFGLEEVFSKGANRAETGQIQMHEDHLPVATFLETKSCHN